MGKQSKVSLSTERRLGENIVLQLIVCLTPSVIFEIFLDNYFISLCLLTNLGVNNIRAAYKLNKNRLCNCTIIGDKQLKKRHGANLNYAHQAEKQFEYGWLERQQCNLHSFF